jgi:hypothetical protein
VRLSLLRFLGAARFHTARWPEASDTPRPPSPSALPHACARVFRGPRGLPGPLPSLARSGAVAAQRPPSSDPMRATSSSGLHGASARHARRAWPPHTPGPGTGSSPARQRTGRSHAAAHPGARPVPGAGGGGGLATHANTPPGCGGAAAPPSAVGWDLPLARSGPRRAQTPECCRARAGARTPGAGGASTRPAWSARRCSPAPTARSGAAARR